MPGSWTPDFGGPSGQLYAEGTSSCKGEGALRSGRVPTENRHGAVADVAHPAGGRFWSGTGVRQPRIGGAARAASRELYNLDRDRALEVYRQAIAADPQDAGAYRGLASALWLSVTFRRGNMTVDDYLGGVIAHERPRFRLPPPETVTAFNDAIERALTLARERVAANPRDADAHYEVGAAIGLRASYIATVEASTLGAFKAAREAYDEHEQVLQTRRPPQGRRPHRRHVPLHRRVAVLPWRWVAYVVGFGGGRDQGLQLVEGAAAYAGDNQDGGALHARHPVQPRTAVRPTR